MMNFGYVDCCIPDFFVGFCLQMVYKVRHLQQGGLILIVWMVNKIRRYYVAFKPAIRFKHNYKRSNPFTTLDERFCRN
jgi:hypothetical protein